MRGVIPGLVNPHPMTLALPGVFQDDDFTVRFVAAFDEILAPILSTLDNVDTYLDPRLCPPDFLAWLAGWVDVELDDNWSLEQQRRMVETAAELARWHGTRRGIVEVVCRWAGVEPDAVEVTDTGGVAWSSTPGAFPPGDAQPHVAVRVRVADPDRVDASRLERLIARAAPAHVAHEVEVVAA